MRRIVNFYIKETLVKSLAVRVAFVYALERLFFVPVEFFLKALHTDFIFCNEAKRYEIRKALKNDECAASYKNAVSFLSGFKNGGLKIMQVFVAVFYQRGKKSRFFLVVFF